MFLARSDGEVYEKSEGNYLVMLNEIGTDQKDLIECNRGYNWRDLTLGHLPSPCFSQGNIFIGY